VEEAERGTGGVEDRRRAWEPADRGNPGGRTRAHADAMDEDRDGAPATRAAEDRTPDRPGPLRCGAARRNGAETRLTTQAETAFAEACERPGDRAGNGSEATWRMSDYVRKGDTEGMARPCERCVDLASAAFSPAALPPGFPDRSQGRPCVNGCIRLSGSLASTRRSL